MNVAKLNVVMPSLIVLLVAKLIQNVNQIVIEILPHASKLYKNSLTLNYKRVSSMLMTNVGDEMCC